MHQFDVSTHQGNSSVSFRPDVQALRGIAVLLVLFYHSDLPPFRQGYLGVDIFFVISGFLITRIIIRDIAEKSFSFRRFYLNRARRILPAAYVVMAVTAIAASLLLTTVERLDFRHQLVGTLVFAANIEAWLSASGYFAGNSSFRPLLHMWSLGIEEQYYAVVPLLFVLTPRRYWLGAVVAIILGSLSLCLYAAYRYPGAAFYLLPTRAWELGLGSLGSFLIFHAGVSDVCRRIWIAALAILLIVPVVPTGLPHPGADAVLVCVATLIIILARAPGANRGPVVGILARVGDISYSLYLVHWPLFAIVRCTLVDAHLPAGIAIVLLTLSFALAILLYTFVENPGRRMALTPPTAAAGYVVASVGLTILPALLQTVHPLDAKAADEIRPATGLAGSTCFEGGLGTYKGCAQSDKPVVLVWGDSFAGHITPGILATVHEPIAEASKGMCAAFANLSVRHNYSETVFAKSCLAFNTSVLDYIAQHPSIRTVVLSSRFGRFMDPGAQLVQATGTGYAYLPPQRETVVADLIETVRRLRALDKRVVIVSPPPSAIYDQGQCWLREREGLPVFGAFKGCPLDAQTFADPTGEVAKLWAPIVADTGVDVVRLDQLLCTSPVTCLTRTATNAPIFRDGYHLSNAGSVFAAEKAHLGERILK